MQPRTTAAPRTIQEYGLLGWGYVINDTSFTKLAQGYTASHKAIDIGNNAAGTSVSSKYAISVYYGIVIEAKWLDDLGWHIIVRTDTNDPNGNPYQPQKLVVAYNHLKSLNGWAKGNYVYTGQYLAQVGNTGSVGYPPEQNYHLHFYITRDGTPYGKDYRVNPQLFYPNLTFTGNTSSIYY